MRTSPRELRLVALLITVAAMVACDRDPTPLGPVSLARAAGAKVGNLFPFADPTGTVATFSTNGALDQGNAFFQDLGTNGRTCGTCHLASNGFGLAAAEAQARFAASSGLDPLFAAVDGANCSDAPPGDANARSLLIHNGLIRIGLTVPATAEYSVEAIHDPYGCALVTDANGVKTASVYRRPLPTTNLGFLSAVMFDGRETIKPLNSPPTFMANLRADLAHQAVDATLGHAQAARAPTDDQVSAIVNFELALFTAQTRDAAAGVLNAQGASGGPLTLADQEYYPGINDPLGGNPTGAAFNPEAFSIFAPWLDLRGVSLDPYFEARKSVARGERVFNTHPLSITEVKGLNDALGVAEIPGNCSTCHDTPNVGNHSLPVPLDIGTSHVAAHEGVSQIAASLGQLSMPDLPVFKLTCNAGPLAGTVAYTSDPMRALISGRCADLNRGKGPILRGLAARAPYFHNGAAATLAEVVEFYNLRFQMGLSNQEKADLVAFLRSL